MDKRTKAALAELTGRTIKGAAIDSDGTLELLMDDGSVARVMSDPEGNGPGSLHYYSANAPGDSFGVSATPDDYGTPIGGR